MTPSSARRSQEQRSESSLRAEGNLTRRVIPSTFAEYTDPLEAWTGTVDSPLLLGGTASPKIPLLCKEGRGEVEKGSALSLATLVPDSAHLSPHCSSSWRWPSGLRPASRRTRRPLHRRHPQKA